MTAQNAGKAFCFATLIACALLHVATFLTIVPGLLILVPFFLLMVAILCARVTQGWSLSAYRRMQLSIPKELSMPKGKTAIAGSFLLAYAILLFISFYKSSGGATSVGIVEGQYVYMYKSTVIRPISEAEYKMFPTHVAREMSAWLAMTAMFCLSSLNQVKDRNAQDELNSTP